VTALRVDPSGELDVIQTVASGGPEPGFQAVTVLNDPRPH
jgi:hypothetical protein